MKTIKLLLLALLFASCSADSPNEDDECHCVKETWTYVTITVTHKETWFYVTGTFTNTETGEVIEIYERASWEFEDVDCQDEVFDVVVDESFFYDVTCN